MAPQQSSQLVPFTLRQSQESGNLGEGDGGEGPGLGGDGGEGPGDGRRQGASSVSRPQYLPLRVICEAQQASPPGPDLLLQSEEPQ